MKSSRPAHHSILLGSIASLIIASVAQTHADSGIVFISPSADTRVFNAPWGVDLNEGGGSNMGIYQSRDRSLLRFDFGLLPAGSSASSAALSVFATDLFGGNPNGESMNIFRLTQAWTEGGVTWNRYDGATNWVTAGGDFDGTVYASSTANPGSGQALTWDITTLTQGWLGNSFANNGLIIINSGTSNGIHFATRENSIAALRPSLKMTISTASTPAPGAWVWNGGVGGAGPVDGAGIWTDANLWWNGAAATWADGNDAVFGAGTGAAGTVTLSGTVAPKSLWFQTTGSGNYTLDGGTIDLTGGVRAVHTSVDATINSTITNGVLFKQGSATLTLNAANTHSGGTTIAGGILKAGNSNALGTDNSFVSVSPGASLDINGQALQNYTQHIHIAGAGADLSLGALGNSGANNLNGIRGITLTGDASVGGVGRWDIGRIDFTVDPATAATHIDGGGFVLTKVGPGDLGILTGAVNLAGFVVAGGRALPHDNTSFGAGPVTVQSGGTVRPWGAPTFANTFNLTGGAIVQEEGFTDTYNGSINVTAPSSFGVTNGTINVNGPISGSGNLVKTGNAALRFTGNNTQTGTLNVAGGSVRFGSTTGNATQGNVEMTAAGAFLIMEAPNQFGPSSGIHFNSAGHAEIALYGNSQTVASLSSVNNFAVVQNSHGGFGAAAASSTLTVNQSTDTTYSGIVRNNTGNDAFTLALAKSGPGKLTLNTNTEHTGGTTVNGGVLEIAGSGGGQGRLRGTVTVNTGGELRYTDGDGTGFGYAGGNKIDTLNINGGLVSSPGVTHVWNATVNMTGGELRSNNGVSDPGGSQLEWGNSSVNTFPSADSAIISGRIRLRPDASPTITFDVADGAADADLHVSAAVTRSSGGVGIVKLGAGNLVFSGELAHGGNTSINAGVLSLDRSVATNYSTGTTFDGTGILRKTGAGEIVWGSSSATFALGAGSLIDVQGGSFVGGSSANENWTTNLSDLNVAVGATFRGVEANVRVDALSGGGTISSGYPGAGYSNFTFGVDGGSGVFSGVLSNGDAPANFVKEGAGTQTLAGNNTYTGTTNVNGGTLIVFGSISGSAVTVNNGGTLRGTGTTGSVSALGGATVAPGIGLGILNTGSLAMASGSTLSIGIDGLALGTQYDQLNVNGTVDITGATLSITGTYLTSPAVTNDLFTILLNDGDIDDVVGTFAGLPEGSQFSGLNGQDFTISYVGGDGNDIVLTAVPEPGSAVLVLGGLGALLGMRRRRAVAQ